MSHSSFCGLAWAWATHRSMNAAIIVLLGMSAGVAPAQVWINPMSAGTPMGTYNLGDTLGSWNVNFEIGAQTWSSSQVGIGPDASGNSYNWGAASWYQDGSYPNKDVRRDLSGVQFTATGKWYVVCQAKANSGDAYTSKSGNGWGNPTAYPPSDLAQAYFQVNPLGNPSSVTLSTNATLPATSLDLAWSKWSSKNAMVVRATNTYSTAPSQGSAYSVGAAVGTGTVVYNSNGTGTTDTNLLPGTRYYYTLYSENYSYYSPGYQTSLVTRCAAPAAAAASGISVSGFTANWSAATGATNYLVDVSTNNGFANYVPGWQDAAVPTNATSTNVAGLSSGLAYYYRVRAANESGTSTNSSAITVYTLCAAPFALSATSTNAGGFTAAWNASTGATNYILDVATDNGFSSFVTGYNSKDVGNSTSAAVTGLSAGQTYYYRVRAGNPGGVSTSSGTITVSTTAQSAPTLASPTAASIADTSATLGATITSDGNSAILSRGTAWGLSAAPTGNSASEGGTAAGAFTQPRSGLTAGSLIYYRGWASNAMGIAFSPDGSFYTLSTEPPAHAGSFTAAAASDTAISLSWTAASGANGYLIFQHTGATPTFLPADATAYTEGQSCGSDTLAKLVASGSTTNASITGLSAGSAYYFTIMPYAWDGAHAATYNCLTSAPVPSASATTFAAEPAASASAMAFTNLMATQVGVSWANGNGARRIVVARAGAAVTAQPVDGQGYAADANFAGTGAALGDGSRVVYDGTGSSVTLVGLTAGTAYDLAVFEYNGTAGTQNYRTTSPATGTIATLGNPTWLTAARDSGNSATRTALGWSRDNSRNVMVVRRTGAPVAWTPAEGTSYADNTDLGSGTLVLLGSTALTAWTNGTAGPGVLKPGTTYYYKLFTEYFGHYSTGAETNITTGLPQTRNTSGGAPEQPASLHLGDTGAAFGCDSWATVDANWARWRMVIHTNAALANGTASTYSSTQSSEHKTATSPQFTATGTWYWGMQVDYGGNVGDQYWYASNTAAWADMPTAGVSSLTLNVLALPDPLTPSAACTPATPTTSIDVAWIPTNSYQVLIVRGVGAPAGAPSNGVSYSVSDACGGGTVIYKGFGANMTDASRTPGTRYYYTLYSENYSYYSPGYATSVVTVCAAPVAGSATAPSASGFTANWSAATGATGSLVDVSTNSGFASFVSGWQGASVPAGATSTNVSGLAAGQVYYYRVRATNESGTSTNSATITAYTLCAAPVALPATSTNTAGFTAAWNTTAGATNYSLDVATDSGFSSFVTGYNGKDVGAATSSAVTGLAAGQTYYYRVRAGNPGGVSASSDPITVTTTASSIPTLASPTVSAIGDTTATLGATVTSDGNAAILSRGTVWGLSAVPTANSATEGGTATGAFAQARSGLTAGTLIHYRGWASNAVGLAYSPDGTFFTLSAEPSTHAGAFTATATSESAISLTWTPASGASGYLVFRRQGAVPTFLPADTNAYTEGQTCGDSVLVALVTSGATTNAAVSGLSAATAYAFTIVPYAWNGTDGATYNYLTDAPVPSASATTFATEPTTSASGMAFTNLMETQMSVSWGSGNGTRRLVAVRAGTAVAAQPVDGQGYTADTNFAGGGTTLSDGSRVTYDGTGNGFTLVGLTAGTTYHLAVFEYNGSAGTQNYRTTSPATGSLATLANPSGVTAVRGTGTYPTGFPATRIALSWTKDSNRNVLVVRRTGAPVAWSPAQGTTYPDNDSSMGNNTVILYGSTGVSAFTNGGANVSALTPNTTYYYKFYTEYYGHYSAGIETHATTGLPQARNTNGGAVDKPSSVYVGDTGKPFSCDTWASADGNWGRSRLFIHTNAAIANGSATAYTLFLEVENKAAAAPQFTHPGTWYWGFQVDYGATIGDQYWYAADSAAWTDMATSGVSTLTVNVQALPDPTSLSAAPDGTNAATRINLGWTRDATPHDVLVVRSDDNSFFTPTPGQAYNAGYTNGNDTVVYRGSATTYQDTGLLPGRTYYYRFFSENLSYYSAGATTNTTTAMPAVRNTNGSGPEQPASIHLGDTNLTFGCDGWGTVEGNYGKERVVISTNADFTGGLYGAYGDYVNMQHRQASPPQFSATGTWYWAIQLEYGSPYGSNFWYGTDSTAWTPAALAPQPGLTVNVQALPDPTVPSAVTNALNPSNSVDLAWSPNGYQVLVVRGTGGAPSAPTGGQSYTVGNPCGSGTVVYKGSGTGMTDGSLTSGVSYTYVFYSENNSYYSAGVAATATTRSGFVTRGSYFTIR